LQHEHGEDEEMKAAQHTGQALAVAREPVFAPVRLTAQLDAVRPGVLQAP
jgi:hypothetical protein